ncbi:transpeptidase family protein [Myxococcus sp. CA051A]|uniref:PASTA domain-containing protein n=1 Tax=Myxococcus llanfairpwllgwyngyllgogerychwyrndrobwllllantysiliogogogochensis TaxID=2590453 RepID=A0A540WLU8_9BACT|nr:penicillin-binding protein [Myxococcus llanfairpwllgwyngyllgogerychwyrndrobwllllantysiliogogogochensis]NTX00769.1 transpeptidase family protein [Myxococcus sp. CA040A]NTX59347.1 transpeptidase family protein [Myxococcus sp. CA051A]TQF09988.1 PASTA domain-containing protein [Myxococcus llanfairpwllgwyngyllgogerychwyrndrobwllllantysiliogogogochensis]
MRDFKATRAPESNAKGLKLRVQLLFSLFLLLLGVAFGRAVQLQVFEQEKLRGMAQDQYVRQIEIPARRGDIFDRRGTPLAQSVEVDSIWVDPSMLPDVRQASRSLAKALKVDADELGARLARSKRFAWVKRQAKPQEVAAVKALGLPGMGFTKEPKRFYPQRELGAHVVGMVGMDGKGLEGLELAFEDELSGQNSRMSGFRDAKGRKLLVQGALDPLERQGAAVTLTLDRHLQYVAEKSLAKAVEEAKGIAGMVVALDPKTGELLALANHPRFNPNTPESIARGTVRNRGALDTFEPGSTTKPFVVATALEEKSITEESVFFCENGAWRVGRHTINDTHSYGWLAPRGILQVSSNICMAKMAQVLGREKMVAGYHAFGFAERTGLALPGEGRGVIPFPKAEVSLATQSFGQGMTATAVQIAAAYGALANDGVLMRPYLVSKVVDPDGVVLLENRPTEVRRAVSAKVARQVVGMLESVVVKGGTAPKAAMEEYRVAGKTGTAQKADPVARGYSDKRIASFVGMVPAEDPRIVILVVVDEPKTDVYGGLVAAPAFKEIATAAMAHLAVPPSRTVAPGVAMAAATPVPVAAKPVAKATEPARPVLEEAVSESPEAGTVRVPDVQGAGGREAVVKLLAAALEPQVMGSGRVVSQTPAAGSLVEKGARVTLELATRQ